MQNWSPLERVESSWQCSRNGPPIQKKTIPSPTYGHICRGKLSCCGSIDLLWCWDLLLHVWVTHRPLLFFSGSPPVLFGLCLTAPLVFQLHQCFTHCCWLLRCFDDFWKIHSLPSVSSTKLFRYFVQPFLKASRSDSWPFLTNRYDIPFHNISIFSPQIFPLFKKHHFGVAENG